MELADTAYKRLAERLDALPNGFPPTTDGVELRLLAKLFTEEEAELAAQLRLTLETPEKFAERMGGEPAQLRKQLKGMFRRGLINAGQADGGLGFGLLPFVVGIYEMQGATIDAELAGLFEQYYHTAFREVLKVQPAVHRVIPVNESIKTGLEVHPFESAAQIIAGARAWGVIDCICRVQKRLIGEPCEHPIDVCLTMSSTPGAFDHTPAVRALTQETAMATLQRAAEAGLVHSVSNNQKGVSYICNCCTCSCGILRGMAELGLANVVARSAYLNQVDQELCLLCGLCLERCQFDALSLNTTLTINEMRCVGCGVCTLACPEGALKLVLRPEGEAPPPPETGADWLEARAIARHLRLDELL